MVASHNLCVTFHIAEIKNELFQVGLWMCACTTCMYVPFFCGKDSCWYHRCIKLQYHFTDHSQYKNYI